jgi:hypothetical protein
METFITVVFLSAVARLVLNAIRDPGGQNLTIAPAPESICLNCVYAHIARGYRASEELTYCTYAGTARELKFAVSDCSMFCHRCAGPEIVQVIGFADSRPDWLGISAAARLNSDY